MKSATIEAEYLGPIRNRLVIVARRHMVNQGCTEVRHDEFAAMVQTVPFATHVDSGDINPVIFIQP